MDGALESLKDNHVPRTAMANLTPLVGRMLIPLCLSSIASAQHDCIHFT